MPTMSEVKSILRNLKLPCTGSKERLEARLAAYIAGKPFAGIPTEPSYRDLEIHPQVLEKCEDLYSKCAFPHDEDLIQVTISLTFHPTT
eukprot:SAG31_NODE_1958_length_6814_cov_3.386597_7_plen_89_part_00